MSAAPVNDANNPRSINFRQHKDNNRRRLVSAVSASQITCDNLIDLRSPAVFSQRSALLGKRRHPSSSTSSLPPTTDSNLHTPPSQSIMATDISPDSPEGSALKAIILPKLIALGWSSGMQDETLAEYILLLLQNGISKEQLTSDLSTDMVETDDQNSPEKCAEFTDWLFDQVANVRAGLDVGQAADAPPTVPAALDAPQSAPETTDATMGEDDEPEIVREVRRQLYATTLDQERTNYLLTKLLRPSVPTGPKAQRNGSQKPRDKRMLGQMNKGPDQALHRIRTTPGTGRINTHAGKEPPKGPRSQQVQRGLGMMNGGRGGMQGMQAMPMPGMMGGAMPDPNMMDPQNQMFFYQSLAENAKAMAMQMQQMSQFMGPNAYQKRNQNNNVAGPANRDRKVPVDKDGVPIFMDRYNRPKKPRNRSNGKDDEHDGDTEMSGENETDPMNQASSRQVPNLPDLARTVCRYDVFCQKADCPYAHHSPMAGSYDNLEPIDMDTECSYGAACKNKFCKGRHPSRAKKFAHQQEQECQFGPFCTKFPNCPFRHDNTRACKNGADCPIPDCKFWHCKVPCKHNPCMNHYCAFKHEPGQKQKWADANGGPKGNTAERKFVDEDAPEEVIIPGKQEEAHKQEEVEANMDTADVPAEGAQQETDVIS